MTAEEKAEEGTQARLHPEAGRASCRAAGISSRIRLQKWRRQTSFSDSGPIENVREAMPCWTRVISSVSSALTRRLMRQLR